MHNHYTTVLKKVPIWKILLLVLGIVALDGYYLQAQGFSSSTDIIEIEDIHVESLSAQAGKCYQESAYYITQDFRHLYFKAPVPLTGNLNLVVSSDVEIAFCALEQTLPGTLTIKPGSIQDNKVYLDTLKLTGLTPCDTIYYEIKSYDFRVGTEVKVCLYEPVLAVDCHAAAPTIFTDSNAGILTGSGSTVPTGYKPNEHTTTVICPTDPDKKFVSLDFNEFWLQAPDPVTGQCLDYMEILDGNSPFAPPISINGKTRFCGNDLFGELVYATNWPSGCLTVVFHSNSDTITGVGWEALANCHACNINFKANVTQSCVGNDRRIDIAATGGSGEYEYRLNGGSFQDVGTFYTSIAAFPATIVVKDKNDHTCTFQQTIVDDSQPLAISIHEIHPTNCDGKDGSVTVKVLGGVQPYKFDLQGDRLTGGFIDPIKLNDSLFLFRGLTLNQFDPVTGVPLKKLIEVEITDGNSCISDAQDRLYSSCAKVLCGMDNLPVINTEKMAYYCAEDERKTVIIDTFSVGNAADGWLISDTAVVHIFEGQGKTGKLIASYSRNHPPQLGDFPLFTKSSCITVFVANDNIGTFDNRHLIKTTCADCDYTVDVDEYNADCADQFGKAVIKIWGDSDYTVTLLESFPRQSWQLAGNKTAGGTQELSVGGLIEGRYTFKIVENWFKCEQYVTVDIGRNDGPNILNIDVTNETCDKQSTPNGTALITVAGGSGDYLYSIQGDAPGSDFFPTPVDGTTADLDPRKDTVAFLITGLEGNGFLTQTTSYSLVVKDAYLTSSDCKDAGIIEVGDNCFNKLCGGTFYDAFADRHVMPTNYPLSRANYADDIPFVSVICPSVHNEFVTVAFDTFLLAAGDTLNVYDSTAVGTDSVLINHYVGYGLNKRSVTAKNATGCLTFEFKPNNDGTTAIGWFGQIECHQACDLSLYGLQIRKETCEEAKDGSVDIKVIGGTDKKVYSLRPLGTPLAQAIFQRDPFFTNLVEGDYIYVVKDDLIPNCTLTDTIEVDRHPPISWVVKSPGLTCGARESTVTIIPRGGSGTYKILPAGIEADAAIINEGEAFTYNLIGAGSFRFKINDAANPIRCYEFFNVTVNDNCRFTCYENEQFSSNRPFDGTLPVAGVNEAGYVNYEHIEITYCSHFDNNSIKADFRFLETEKDLDVLSIYHGKGTYGPLVGHFSGTDHPGTIISTAPDGCLTFAFETNRVNNDFAGFLADLSCVSCQLSATYKEVSGETYCWNADGDQNGFIKVAVDNPVITDAYEFQLRSVSGAPLSAWKTDNNDDAIFPDLDDEVGPDTTSIDDLYLFGKLPQGTYKVAVRSIKDTTCMISLQPVEIKKIDQLEVTYSVTNANCEGDFGGICITPLKGSGRYSFSNDNFSMTMNTACFPGFNGQTMTINVMDDVTGCTTTVTATIGSDCHVTCGDTFTDDAGWNGIPGDSDDGSALYAKNVDSTWIFCPTHDDKFVELNFLDFHTSVEDTLKILDGDGFGVIIGEYSGTNSPGLVRSSNGCLTVKFKSNDVIEKKGWRATVGCFYCPTDLQVAHNVTDACGFTGAVQVTATASGYTATDFVYSLDGINWNNNNGFFGSIPPGTDKVYAKVREFDNCIVTADLTIHSSLVLDYTTTNSACNSNSGSIILNGNGGTGRYSYQLGTNPGNLSPIVGSSINGLAGGTYVARMIDSNAPGCWQDATIVVGKETCAPVTTCVNIETYLFLEGAYNPQTGVMRTSLNDLGYLPGQQPSTFFGTPTIAGQPYNVGPWSHRGTEGIEYNHVTVGNAKAGYHPDVVDWVLLSLRSSSAKSSTVCRYAALLYKDGSVRIADNQHDCCQLDPSQSYYVVVEHRNHLMVMSHAPMPILNGTVKYDFRVRDSYKGFFGVGQKQLPTGVYALYCGNGDQTSTSSAGTDVNVADKNIWVKGNGANSAYYFTDFDMNGDVNGLDKGVWLDNNGKACDVPNN